MTAPLNPAEQLAKLEELLAKPDEYECLEFKHAENDYEFEKLGR